VTMILRAVLCSLVLLSSPVIALAVTNGPVEAPQRVALVDVARVFKAHSRFNASLEQMKKDAEMFQAMMRSEQEKIAAEAEVLKQIDPKSPEFKAKETEISKKLAELQVTQSQKGREISEKEARLYFDTYVEVTQQIANYADRNGIGLVLRFNSEPIDSANRQSVIEGVNREIVYQVGRDITNQVIATINGTQVGANPRVNR